MSTNTAWKQLERGTRKELQRIGFDAKRVYGEQWAKSYGADVVATDGDITLKIQCKNQKTPNMRQAYHEAKTTITGKKDRAIVKAHYVGTHETYALLSWKDFISLLKGEW
jgi:Holliday junction resolvase